MNALREALDSYLLMRRGLGYSLKAAGKTLSKFLSFLEERGATYITTVWPRNGLWRRVHNNSHIA